MTGDDDGTRRGPRLGRPPSDLQQSVGAVRERVADTLITVRETVGAVAGGRSLLAVPHEFEDRAGRTVRVRPAREGDVESLVAMYDGFDPADRAQGTPPAGEPAIRSWLAEVREGVDAVAVRAADGGPRVVGHAMFVPDGTDRHEFAIFVAPDHQGAGVGTDLALAAMGHARTAGVSYVWLSVSASERGLQKWYSTLGFSTVNPMGTAHRMSRTL